MRGPAPLSVVTVMPCEPFLIRVSEPGSGASVVDVDTMLDRHATPTATLIFDFVIEELYTHEGCNERMHRYILTTQPQTVQHN